MPKRHWLSAILCALLVLVVGQAVCAQGWGWDNESTARTSHPFELKGGIVFPLGDTVDNSMAIGGLEYKTGVYYGAGTFTLSGDYIPVKTRRLFVVGTEAPTHTVSLIPVFLNYRLGDEDGSGRQRFFYGFGAGAYIAGDDIPEMRLDKGGSFAWQAFAGIGLSPTISLEGRFIAGTKPADDGLIGVQLGIRF